jgi:hypothetical protein
MGRTDEFRMQRPRSGPLIYDSFSPGLLTVFLSIGFKPLSLRLGNSHIDITRAHCFQMTCLG